LSKHKGLIDCARKSVKLTREDGQELEHVAEPLVTHKGATNHLKPNQLEVGQSQKVRDVDQYLDIYPKDLPSMLLDRDIEFGIESFPGTAPI
jgi:hypothetical protein